VTNHQAKKVELTGVPATLLITLYAKALDYRAKKSVLNDARADQIVRSLDRDLSGLDYIGSRMAVPLRAKQFDEWLNAFLRAYPESVVLNLGCGLDTRVTRIAPSSGVRWFDIDLPDAIAIRRQFYDDMENYTMLGRSLLDRDLLADLPGELPAIVVAEGVLEYLTEDEVRGLLGRITSHFSRGEIVFDVMSSFAIESGKSSLAAATGAAHQWAVDDIEAVDRLNPALRRIGNLSVLRTKSVRRLPWKLRLLCDVMAFAPRFRAMIRLLRYEFPRDVSGEA
jgi:O-methyltransferase involved in polyketide biosynthesis